MTGSNNGIEAGKAFVKWVMDDREVNKGLAKIGERFQRVGKIGASIAGPIAGAFTAAIASFTKTGSALADMSARTGVGAEALSKLSYGAEMTGASLESLESALRVMSRKGSGGAGDIETRLGNIADELAGIEDPGARAKRAMELLGRAGSALLPMLSEGSAGLQKFGAEAQAAGAVMTDEAAAAADTLGDSFDNMQKSVMGVANAVGFAMAPAITSFLDGMAEFIAKTTEVLSLNPQLVAALGSTAFAFTGASVAAGGFGVALTLLAASPAVLGIGAVAAELAAIIALYNAMDDYYQSKIEEWSGVEIAKLPTDKFRGKNLQAPAVAMSQSVNAGMATVNPAGAPQGAFNPTNFIHLSGISDASNKTAQHTKRMVALLERANWLLSQDRGILVAY